MIEFLFGSNNKKLLKASEEGDIETVKKLLTKGDININYKDILSQSHS